MSSPCVDLRLLGGFELRLPTGQAEVPESAQRLIAFLALRRRPQTRLCVAGNLWPEKSDARATANLRSTLWRARLEDGTSAIVTKGSLVGIDPAVRLDVADLERVKADTASTTFCANGQPAYERLFDELLPGWYEDWVLLERERLVQLQLRIAEALAVALVHAGDLISATDIAYRTQALDPTGETRNRIARLLG
jgi:DNA-binding SARP family transcriptional activator